MEERSLTGLIERSKAGDMQAIEELLKESHASVSYKCRRMLGNEQDAEDLTQEILLVVYTRLNTLGDPEAYWGWLNRIATNRCYNFLERNHKELQFAEDEDGNSVLDTVEILDERQIPDKAMDNAETARMIDEIVTSLPDTQRAAIFMYYYDEMSVREIAQTMNIPEGTVKRRLDLARNKIEARVKDYEKQGIKLYSVSVLPFLWYYLRLSARSEANTYAAKAAAASIVAGGSSAGAATASGTATATVSAGTGAAGSAAARVLSAISGKVIAGIAAAAILVGGGAVALGGLSNNNENNNPTETQAIVETVPTVEDTAETEVSETQETANTEPPAEPTEADRSAEAYAAYEELLSRGITDQGVQIAYYAYPDLNQDEIPELLVSDGPGTPDTMSQGELYTWDGVKIVSCGLAGAYYDSFYLANGRYVRGLSRMGTQFLSPAESIFTTIYYWDQSMSRNDPAISYNNKDWEYITADEFDYYNTMPDGNSHDCFVQTAETISLTRNSFAASNQYIMTSYFAISLPQDWQGKYLYDVLYDVPGGIQVKIYERTNREAGGDGWLGSVMIYESRLDYFNLPSYEYKGSCKIDGKEYDIVMLYPSDARFIYEGPDAEKYKNAYRELNDDLYEDCLNDDPRTDHLRIIVYSQYFVEQKTEVDIISPETSRQIFNDAKVFYDSYIYGRMHRNVMEYPVEWFQHIDGVIEHEGCLYEPIDQLTYGEFVDTLHSFFTEKATAELISEMGLMEYNGKCYAYIADGLGDPCLDYSASAQLSADENYEFVIIMTDLDGEFVFHHINCCKEEDQWVLDSGNFYAR